MLLKAEGIDILKKTVMEKFIKTDNTTATDNNIPKYLS